MKVAEASVLVTGATGGLGQSIAREFSQAGASVVVSGRRTGVLDPFAAQIGGRAIAADLADRAAVLRLLDEAGPVDIVVANAALPASGLLTDYDLDGIDRVLDVNLGAPIVMAKLAAERMIPRKRGHLVFVSSISGKAASTRASLYNATKFGLRGFALGLREDLRPHGIGVSTIFPGFIRGAGMFAETGVKLPLGLGTRTPRDVARAVIRAIERDRAEIDVAPPFVRFGGLLSGIAPQFAARMQRLAGADRIATAISEGQRDKR